MVKVTAPKPARETKVQSRLSPSYPSRVMPRMPSMMYVTGLTVAMAWSQPSKLSMGAKAGAMKSSGKKIRKLACAACALAVRMATKMPMPE